MLYSYAYYDGPTEHALSLEEIKEVVSENGLIGLRLYEDGSESPLHTDDVKELLSA